MKEYANDELAVCWRPERCIHSGKCVKGLPEVFDRRKRPWINMAGASSEEIMKTIDKCPSGALSYKRAGGNRAGENETIGNESGEKRGDDTGCSYH
ncbi:MAG TPA: (4Fe-4S)-binding protein [Methanothrix sp.]|nr:(4Fe-4S)-binding protein [Methanothrix sp.]